MYNATIYYYFITKMYIFLAWYGAVLPAKKNKKQALPFMMFGEINTKEKYYGRTLKAKEYG